MTNLVYPDGKNVYYAYDSLNRLTNVIDWAGRTTSIASDLAGRVTTIMRPNGTYRTIAYDSAGEATNILEQTPAGMPIALFRLNWDAAARAQWEFGAPLPHTNAPPSRTMTYDDDNRLFTVNGNSVTVDLDGNLTSGPLTNDTFVTYGYDARNRLLNVAGINYAYDPAGNRVGLTNGANVTRFVINPNAGLSQVLMRVKNGVTTYYVYGLGLLYEVDSFGNTKTYHYDYRGSTVAITDGSGNITDRIEYSAYATTTYRAGTTDTPFLFNGRYGVMTDPNGLLYMRARYYNPYLCRFINADPSGFSGGLNFYAYADGNPVSFVDPYGLYGNRVSGPNGPVGPSDPFAPGGVFFVPTPLQPSPAAYFLGGVAIGGALTAVVVFAAPAAVSGLVAVGVPATTASATVTIGLGTTAVIGGVATGIKTYDNAVAGNWNAVAFNVGTLVGGSIVGASGGGRALAEGISGEPTSAKPGLFGDVALDYDPNFPNGNILNWLASGPSPQSGGASATLTAAGAGLLFQPSVGTQSSPATSVNPALGAGASTQSSSTGK